MAEQITLAKACMEYFSDSRRVTTIEYRELSFKDKVDLRESLIQLGYDIAPLTPPKSDET